MPRLLPIAAALVALALPGTAYAVPVSPVPVPSATFDGPVRSAVYWGDVVYIAGDFLHAKVNGLRYKRTRLAAVNARTGALLDWTPTADALVVGIAADSSGIYIAGDFRKVNGINRDSLAKLDSFNGALRPGFNHQIYGHPRTLAVGHGRVYLGGTLTSVNGQARSRAAAFSAATGALDTGWAPNASDVVLSIYPSSDRVYLGGRFDTVNGAAGTQKLASVHPENGSVTPGFASKVTSLVHEIVTKGDTLYAAIDGNGGKAMAVNAQTGAAKWTITTDGDVQAIAVLDDTVYLGGHFDNVCKSANTGSKGVCLDGSTKRIKLAAVNTSGTLLNWVANGNGSVGVHTLVANATIDQVLAGGEFTAVNGADQRRFALFNLPR